MSKYYLLTFCEDFADEMDITATAVMSEEEYNKWYWSYAWGVNEKEIDEAQHDLIEKYKDVMSTIPTVEANFVEASSEFNKKYGKRYGINPEAKAAYNKLHKDRRKPYNDMYDILESLRNLHKMWTYPNVHLLMGNMGNGYEQEDWVSGHAIFRGQYSHRKTEVSMDFVNVYSETGLDRMNLCTIFEKQ